MQTLNKPNRFLKVLIGLILLSFTLLYSCNSSSTEDKKDTMSDSSSTMSTSDTTMKISSDSSSVKKIGLDTTKDSSKGGQPTPTGH